MIQLIISVVLNLLNVTVPADVAAKEQQQQEQAAPKTMELKSGTPEQPIIHPVV